MGIANHLSNQTIFAVSDWVHGKTAPLSGSGSLPDGHVPGDGVHRVLATLAWGDGSYRILADLLIEHGRAELRCFRFEGSRREEGSTELQIRIPVARTEIAPLERRISGADFVLCTPVRLDPARTAIVFGPSGPAAT